MQETQYQRTLKRTIEFYGIEPYGNMHLKKESYSISLKNFSYCFR